MTCPLIRLLHYSVGVCFEGHHIEGELTAWGMTWGFRSADPFFLDLFPSGNIYSFNVYGIPMLMVRHRKLHELIAQRFNEVTGR